MKQSDTVGAQLLWGGRYGCNNGRYSCTIVMSYIEMNKALSQWLLTFNLWVSVTWPLTCAFHIPCTHTPEIFDMHRGVCDKTSPLMQFVGLSPCLIMNSRGFPPMWRNSLISTSIYIYSFTHKTSREKCHPILQWGSFSRAAGQHNQFLISKSIPVRQNGSLKTSGNKSPFTMSLCLYIYSIINMQLSCVRVRAWLHRLIRDAGRGLHLIHVRTFIWVALAVLRTPYVDRVYRENLHMDWHIFTFRCWFVRAMPFRIRDG